jgi:hypothetical protein
MIDWQTIGTAPKDESFVMLFFPEGGPSDEDHYKFGFWSPDGDWFESESSSHSLTDIYGQPSHWAALQPPDNVAETEAGEEV